MYLTGNRGWSYHCKIGMSPHHCSTKSLSPAFHPSLHGKCRRVIFLRLLINQKGFFPFVLKYICCFCNYFCKYSLTVYHFKSIGKSFTKKCNVPVYKVYFEYLHVKIHYKQSYTIIIYIKKTFLLKLWMKWMENLEKNSIDKKRQKDFFSFVCGKWPFFRVFQIFLCLWMNNREVRYKKEDLKAKNTKEINIFHKRLIDKVI